MKLFHPLENFHTVTPAAFRRLCVETSRICLTVICQVQPPSGGCVLKRKGKRGGVAAEEPAAFRRLCVETTDKSKARTLTIASRLQAAVC